MVLNSSQASIVPNSVEVTGNDLRTLPRFVVTSNLFLPNTPVLQYPNTPEDDSDPESQFGIGTRVEGE